MQFKNSFKRFGQLINHFVTSIESIQISSGKDFSKEPIFTQKNFEFNLNGEIQDIMFSQPMTILNSEFYNIKIKIRGEMTYRGNPFDLKEIQMGSDGTLFEFSEPGGIAELHVNGQMISMVQLLSYYTISALIIFFKKPYI